jgi:hypothetical protein
MREIPHLASRSSRNSCRFWSSGAALSRSFRPRDLLIVQSPMRWALIRTRYAPTFVGNIPYLMTSRPRATTAPVGKIPHPPKPKPPHTQLAVLAVGLGTQDALHRERVAVIEPQQLALHGVRKGQHPPILRRLAVAHLDGRGDKVLAARFGRGKLSLNRDNLLRHGGDHHDRACSSFSKIEMP